MKNLLQALEMLASLQGQVEYDIYGPIDDETYWEKCTRRIRTLPPNIKVTYRGIITHDRVLDVLRQYDLFFMPTLGENFGDCSKDSGSRISSACLV
jgi:glycosyltransferase involved in cell wall biosynthesis